jgi:metal-responsive CopG/Arc/MetJ family transcriptional regulator
MKDTRVTVRLPGEIARALDKYCNDNYLDRSTAMRTALINWEPFKEYLEREKNKQE